MTLKEAVEGFKPTTEAEAALKDLCMILGEITEVLSRELPGAQQVLYERAGGLMTLAQQAAGRMFEVATRQSVREYVPSYKPYKLTVDPVGEAIQQHLEYPPYRTTRRGGDLVRPMPLPLFGQSGRLVIS